MFIRMCMAKIHRATVTEANLDYVGSITIDENLIEAAGMRPGQYVIINNLRKNDIMWQTYIMAGERGSGVICLNGPPAHYFSVGDKVIILAELWGDPKELHDFTGPRVVFVDEKNDITSVKGHPVN